MWLHAVDHVPIPLHDHHDLTRVLIPEEDAPAVATAEYVPVPVEVGLLDLKIATYEHASSGTWVI